MGPVSPPLRNRLYNKLLYVAPIAYWVVFLVLVGQSPLSEAWKILWYFECIGTPVMIFCIFAIQLLSKRNPFAWTAVLWFSIVVAAIGLCVMYCILGAIPFGHGGR